MTKQSNQREKSATMNADGERERRFIKMHHNEENGTIEFRMFVLRPGRKRSTRIFGSGFFAEQDVYCIATALSELASSCASAASVWIHEGDESWEGGSESEGE